ncbi:transposase [Rhizobium leguminosarum]|uniref:transposase n=1 Tax=Rhizobium leguminosarum TaxID=384 RepID=UPI00103A527C|nr:transposase [Rhizobium leguminosarum]QND19259.1 transposase [Rhizobium leguminosarum bv. viciae]TBZ59716.1 transposase [Rhizobium leguminosarum bv. viciae]
MGQPDEEYYGAEDAIAAFDALSDKDRNNLGRIARFIAGTSGFPSPDDLINEAYVRIAEGKRRWPRAHGFVPFVAGVMKSLRSDSAFVTDERKVVRLDQGFAIVTSEDLQMVAANDDDGGLARKAIIEDAISKLEEHFADDEEMLLLLMGIQEGLIGKDLQEAVGVDEKRLEALRTRLKRKIDNLADDYRAKEGLA